jgi:hypothetical protein
VRPERAAFEPSCVHSLCQNADSLSIGFDVLSLCVLRPKTICAYLARRLDTTSASIPDAHRHLCKPIPKFNSDLCSHLPSFFVLPLFSYVMQETVCTQVGRPNRLTLSICSSLRCFNVQTKKKIRDRSLQIIIFMSRDVRRTFIQCDTQYGFDLSLFPNLVLLDRIDLNGMACGTNDMIQLKCQESITSSRNRLGHCDAEYS